MKLVRGKTVRGNKMVKNDPYMLGPATLTEDTDWDSFWVLIESVAFLKRMDIEIALVTWRVNTSAGKGALPLTNERGLQTMLQQSRSFKATTLLIICLPQPKPPSASVVCVTVCFIYFRHLLTLKIHSLG